MSFGPSKRIVPVRVINALRAAADKSRAEAQMSQSAAEGVDRDCRCRTVNVGRIDEWRDTASCPVHGPVAAAIKVTAERSRLTCNGCGADVTATNGVGHVCQPAAAVDQNHVETQRRGEYCICITSYEERCSDERRWPLPGCPVHARLLGPFVPSFCADKFIRPDIIGLPSASAPLREPPLPNQLDPTPAPGSCRSSPPQGERGQDADFIKGLLGQTPPSGRLFEVLLIPGEARFQVTGFGIGLQLDRVTAMALRDVLDRGIAHCQTVHCDERSAPK